MKIQLASTEALYIEVNGLTIYVDVSIPTEPPIVSYWEDDSPQDNAYTCQWMANV